MKNYLFHLLLIVTSGFFSAQIAQSYDRNWGTYFGGINVGNTTGNIAHKFTEINTGHIVADAEYNSSLNSAYYNQFVTAGMQGFSAGNFNRLEGKLNPDGTVISAKYAILNTTMIPEDSETILYREGNGSLYMKEIRNVQTATSSTNVWLTNPVSEDVKNNLTSLLAKYSANGTLLWKTFIPDDVQFMTVDNSSNIFVWGATKKENLADSNSFQQNFVIDYDSGNLRPNAFLTKLNPNGQKIWSTYYPAKQIIDAVEFDGNLYIVTNDDFLAANTALATLGTFQQTKAVNAIASMNANTGSRNWGTYYGLSNQFAGIYKIRANSTGIYTLGLSFESFLPNSSNYFATSTAYQSSPNGDQDVILSKFNHSGSRIWSTYFGGTQMDDVYSFDLKGQQILFAGGTISSGIATANGFVNSKPNVSGFDIFFTMFNTDGNIITSSYYGGTDSGVQAGFLGGSVNAFFSKQSDSFYLSGITKNRYNISTEGAYQPNIVPAIAGGYSYTPFIAKFSPKSLSVSELELTKDLAFFDNPNNGQFSLMGSILQKKTCSFKIHDVSGKLVHVQKTNKSQKQTFDLQHKLDSGNYILSVYDDENLVVKTFKMVVVKK